MEKKARARRPVALYARISRDAESLEKGVDRQLEDCRKLAEQLGFEIGGEFVDNDISASTKSKKRRPAYDEMMRLARAGEFGAILAYSNSRLTRRVREYMDLIDLHNQHGVALHTVVSGDHDLATADGRGAALTIAVWDQAEAERTAERTRRAKDQMAQDGLWRGGPRPFGYTRVVKDKSLKILPAEAQVVRESMAAVLAGRSLASIARELNEQGVTTSFGKPWTYARLKDVLIRPRNAGLLSHGDPSRPEESGYRREFEIVGEASWPAIVTREEWQAVFEILVDPARRHQNGNDTRWLGSGIYTCGRETELDADGIPLVCGASLRPAPFGGTDSRRGGRKYLYRCVAQAHLTVSADPTDEFVREVVAERVRDARVIAALTPGDESFAADREHRATVARRLEGFERDYAAGRITGSQLQKATVAVTAELEAIDTRLARAVQRSTSSSIISAPDPGAAFLAAPLDIQRAVLASVVRVEIQPQTAARGSAWSPARVKITPA